MKVTFTHLWHFVSLVLLFSLGTLNLNAQKTSKTYIDSVISSVKGKERKVKRQSYYDLGKKIILNENPDDATNLFEYALQSDSSDIAKLVLYENYSKNLSRRGFLKESIALKKKGLELAKDFNDEKSIAFYNIILAFSYDQNNQPDAALESLNSVEDIIYKDELKHLLPNFYHAKSAIYNSLKDYETQEQFLLEMYDVVKDNANTSKKRFYLYLILDYYTQVDKPAQLAKFTEIMAAHYAEGNLNIPKGHMPIAALFERRLNIENIPVLREAVAISDSLNSLNSLVATSIALANIYIAQGEPNKGIPYLESAVAKLKNVNKPADLIDLYSVLVTASGAANNYKKAFDYKLLQASLQDSVTSEKMRRNISEIEIEFETEKKERKILEQRLELQKQSRQKAQIKYGIVALGIFALLLLFFFRFRLKSQKTIAQQTLSIQEQKITELQQKNKLLAMNSMIEGQEAERLRIAKDLHDSLGGLLSTVKVHFTTIQREIEQLESLDLTGKTNALIDEACIEVRRISHNMMPHALSISGLNGALEDLGDQLREQGYDVTLEITNLPEALEATRKVMLYRLVQEIISNIRKHANAQTILIQLMGFQDEITLLVEDDGNGFNYNEAVKKGGLGLKSINSRVAYLDGTIDWDTQIDKGTSLTINIPKT